jgi:Domain of unknown function (DUF4920)/Prokaryotic membrane lipoprotein lipid attachment site
MRKIIYTAFAVLALASCKKNEEIKGTEKTEAYAKFGDSLSSEGAITKEELLAKYKTMKPTDTLNIKVSAKITDVCQKKGCWMNLDLGEGKSAFVKFKDYGFFVPKNAAESEAIVNGKAFIEVTSIDDLKEYAKDAGKSKAAIDSIVTPETNYSFLADGVLIKK